MLDLKTFVAGLVTLQKAYIGWEFDIKDEMQVKIWYVPLQNLTEDQYKWLIKALPFVREVISEKGGCDYGVKAEIYKALEKYPPLHKTVKEFEDTIKNMSANDTYAADRFRRAYESNLREFATAYTMKKLGLALPSGDKQALGSGTLPYEV